MPETEFCLRCTPYGQCGFKKLETRLGFSEITVESLEGLIEESDAFKLRECPFHERILTTLLRQREMLLAQEREGFFPELKARHLGVELQAGSVRQWSKSDMPWVVSNIVDEMEWLKSQGLIVEEMPEKKREQSVLSIEADKVRNSAREDSRKFSQTNFWFSHYATFMPKALELISDQMERQGERLTQEKEVYSQEVFEWFFEQMYVNPATVNILTEFLSEAALVEQQLEEQEALLNEARVREEAKRQEANRSRLQAEEERLRGQWAARQSVDGQGPVHPASLPLGQRESSGFKFKLPGRNDVPPAQGNFVRAGVIQADIQCDEIYLQGLSWNDWIIARWRTVDSCISKCFLSETVQLDRTDRAYFMQLIELRNEFPRVLDEDQKTEFLLRRPVPDDKKVFHRQVLTNLLNKLAAQWATETGN